jgi:hypothetical protein
MPQSIEGLEVRTLFSGTIEGVTVDYDTVVADASAIKADLKGIVANYKADSKVITADIKALGKNKINTKDVAALNKAVAKADALDTKDANKIVAVGKTALSRAKAAFSADVAHPTTANDTKLSKALTTLTTALAPYESTFDTDSSAGDAAVDAALTTLVSANPTATTLASDTSAAEASSSGELTVLSNELVTTNADIDTLAAAID